MTCDARSHTQLFLLMVDNSPVVNDEVYLQIQRLDGFNTHALHTFCQFIVPFTYKQNKKLSCQTNP